MIARLPIHPAGAVLTGLLVFFLIGSCGDSPVTPRPISLDALEYGPVLTFDREFILFTREDSTDHSRSGIYAMKPLVPVRLRLVPGDNLRSPSMSPGNTHLMYLDSGVIHVRDMTTDSTTVFMKNFRFDSAFWIADSILVTELNGKIWIARWPDERSFTFWTNGYDPSATKGGEMIYAGPSGPGKTVILKHDLQDVNPNGAETKVSSLSPVRFPSSTSLPDQYLFSIEEPAAYRIALQRGTENFRAVTSSSMPRALFIDSVRFIYTGPDGLFWTFDITDSTTERFLP